jgi:hypothetical protein
VRAAMKWSWLYPFGAFGAFAAPAAAQSSSAQAFDAALVEADHRFTEGDLDGALAVLEPACNQLDRPECAFNLGAIHHGLGHCEQALAYYRRYRELEPAGDHLMEVEAALEEVEPRCGRQNVVVPVQTGIASPSALVAPSGVSETSILPAPPPAGTSSSPFIVGSFVLSGVAAVSSVVFGVLAANSASECERAQVYDDSYAEECEHRGPSYQGMWQGFAVASGGFLGIGLTLWWFDSRSAASVGVSDAGSPALQYRYRF